MLDAINNWRFARRDILALFSNPNAEMPVDKNELEEESARPVRRTLAERLDFTTLGISLVLIAVSWGSQIQKMDTMNDEILFLRNREMTPGAAAAIAAIRETDAALMREQSALESELRAQRTEIMAYLLRIEQKVDDHMKGGR
jgi:hypothetical protein